MSKLVAKVVPDHDGQAILFPEGQRLFSCDEVTIERQGDALVLRPLTKRSLQDQRLGRPVQHEY